MMRVSRAVAAMLMTGLVALGVTTTCQAEVAITRAPAPWVVSGSTYEVTIGEDGNLTGLSVEGVAFLEHTPEISRGTSFWDQRVYQLFDIQEPAPNVIVASCDEAAIRYEFGDETMVWTVSNKTDHRVSFFLVFHPEVEAVMSGEGEYELTVVREEWEKTTWFRGKARLEITGSTRLWGPWMENHQLWEASLEAGEERHIEFSMGAAPASATEAIADLKAPAPVREADLMVLSPREHQVFQRQTEAEGTVLLSGRAVVPCDRVEVRIVGESIWGDVPDDWRRVAVDANGGFVERLSLSAGGWYRVEGRAVKDGEIVAEAAVEKFGVGEVFVGAGQSNSTNAGQFKTKQTSGMVSSFSGWGWQLADDPQPGSHDNSPGGSYYPAFGDALYERYGVPIGVAVTGHGGTSVTQWQPGGELFEWMMVRIHQLGPQGFRGVLWHQGEADARTPAEEYFEKLKRVIVTSKAAAGWEFPWFVAQASYHNPEHPSWPGVREGQRQLWEMGVALEGPDSDVLTGDNRDYDGAGIHFSPKGLRAHGLMWADKVRAYLDEVLH